MVGWHYQLNGHGLSKLPEMVKTGETGVRQSMGSQRVHTSQQLNNNKGWLNWALKSRFEGEKGENNELFPSL